MIDSRPVNSCKIQILRSPVPPDRGTGYQKTAKFVLLDPMNFVRGIIPSYKVTRLYLIWTFLTNPRQVGRAREFGVRGSEFVVAGGQLSVIGCRLPVVGRRLADAGSRLQVDDCWSSIGGCWWPVGGCR